MRFALLSSGGSRAVGCLLAGWLEQLRGGRLACMAALRCQAPYQHQSEVHRFPAACCLIDPIHSRQAGPFAGVYGDGPGFAWLGGLSGLGPARTRWASVDRPPMTIRQQHPLLESSSDGLRWRPLVAIARGPHTVSVRTP